MSLKTLEADYLVVGSGATGMAFTDSLIADSDAQVIMVDRRHAPGGHWNDAYPFVRLHQPSAYYGVNSLPLGSETIDSYGSNKGLYERATGPEVCAYFSRVMQEKLLPSGRVQYFPMCDYTGEHRFVSRLSGAEYQVRVKKKLVDAVYLETSIPATVKPPFEVAPDARCIPPNELARLTERADGYVIIVAGKTAMDACIWLLETGVQPSDIRWIKPRESWLFNRVYFQGGDLVGTLFEGISLQIEAAAQAESVDDLFARLRACELLLRIDENVTPAMYKAATVSAGGSNNCDASKMSCGSDVRRIEHDRVVLDRGTIPTTPGHPFTARRGAESGPAIPIFGRSHYTAADSSRARPFNAALVSSSNHAPRRHRGLASVHRTAYPTSRSTGCADAHRRPIIWSKEPDISDWLERASAHPRLAHARERGKVQRAFRRYPERAPRPRKLRQLITCFGL
jgi:hypothetical protein